MLWVRIEGINPEPWKMPNLSVGRKGGKTFPIASTESTQRAYQEALKEALASTDLVPVTGDVSLCLFFWRQIASYVSDKGRRVTRHKADATNLQKATEDALQGHLFVNDNQVIRVSSRICEQSKDAESRIVIRLGRPGEVANRDVPEALWAAEENDNGVAVVEL